MQNPTEKQRLAANATKWFEQAMVDPTVMSRANKLAQSCAQLMLSQAVDVTTLPNPELLEGLDERQVHSICNTLQEEIYLVATCIMASGFLVSDGEGGKLSVEDALERAQRYASNVTSLTALNHRHGQMGALGQGTTRQ
jgi:hypothetical protein